MGQEIQRARALMALLSQAKLLPAETASESYEAWVSAFDDMPYSRFLITEWGLDAEKVRYLLRRQAVQGMKHPDLFTVERFRDALIGQLGVQAGILSPKLLKAVRAVQDKKVAEGKLRRLDELLPRAGFDAQHAELLASHLEERVLICDGCLARYPRKDLNYVMMECPRCEFTMEAIDLEASSMDLLPDEARQALMESSEKVYESVTIQDRERGGADTNRRESVPLPVVVMGIALVAGIGGTIYLLKAKEEPKQPLFMTPPTGSGGDAGTQGTPNEAQVRTEKIEGFRNDLQRAKQMVETEELGPALALVVETKSKAEAMVASDPQAGVSVGAVLEELRGLEERLEGLEGVQRRLRELMRPETLSPSGEMQLAQAVVEASEPARALMIHKKAVERLQALRTGRRAEQARVGRERLNSLDGGGDESVWAARTEAALRDPSLAAYVDGEYARGLRIEELSADGFELTVSDGSTRRFRWSEDPVLALAVFRKGARSGEPADQVLLLRLAMLARDLESAQRALEGLDAPRGTVDLEALLADSPTSSPPVREDGLWRLSYPTRWLAHDLEPVESESGSGTERRVVPEGVQLEGSPSELVSRTFRLDANRDEFNVTLEIQGDANQPFMALELESRGTRRVYSIQWSQRDWSLSLAIVSGDRPASGAIRAGGNLLREGSLTSMARRAKLTYEGGEPGRPGRLVVYLGGVELASTQISSSPEAIRFRFGAGSGRLTVERVEVLAGLDEGLLEAADSTYRRLLDRGLEPLERLALFQGSVELPELSVEDPQGLASLGDEGREALRRAKEAVAGQRLEEAGRALDELARAAPGFLGTPYYRGYVALLRGEVARAIEHLDGVLQVDPLFDEARALQALALAYALRFDQAEQAADGALSSRPDLVHARLAEAAARLHGHDPNDAVDYDGPLAEGLREELRRCERLAPSDGLTFGVARDLRRALELQVDLSSRRASEHVVLMAPAEQDALQASLEVLDPAVDRWDRVFRVANEGRSRRLRVAFMEEETFAVMVPNELRRERVVVQPLTGVVLVRTLEVEALDAKLAAGMGRAYSRKRYGALPPWLEFGVGLYLAELITEVIPENMVEIIRGGNDRWNNEEWAELFGLARGEVAFNELPQAKGWSLVRYNRANVRSVIEEALERGRRGRPVPASMFTSLDLGSLSGDLDNYLDRQAR